MAGGECWLITTYNSGRHWSVKGDSGLLIVEAIPTIGTDGKQLQGGDNQCSMTSDNERQQEVT